ncbi:two-component system response regulator [Paenibacillus sp. 32O-W]|uniref:response regulator transcription factor n=1 Tax=Paenibacillus sp. 32O-W TaxID=1695218 RepID=UPI00071F4287|nr:response regulator transcription factor [Paenibacillus sp. 32O-W]ALS26673.1 two-component system response regulator [Paenibacillus sp. 32O-W]
MANEDKRILVVDDEASIAGAISYGFRREGYRVDTAFDGEEALAKAASFRPHLLVLDVMMPKLNGFDVCRRLENREETGIIFLTVKNDIVDKVLGLELGADDYMTKPFDIRELIARAKALLRRLENQGREKETKAVEIGELSLSADNRTVKLNGKSLELTPKEFDLLALLLTRPNRVYTREDLLDLVWGMEYVGGARTVDIHIQRLRKKLGEPYQALLQTVYGIGYKGLGELP